MSKKALFITLAVFLALGIGSFFIGRYSNKPGQPADQAQNQQYPAVNSPSPTPANTGTGTKTTGTQATPRPTPAPSASTASVVKDDLGRFWLLWKGYKYTLNFSGISQYKFNELVVGTKPLVLRNCASATSSEIVYFNYDLYLVVDKTYRYGISYKTVTGNYIGSFPTAQNCLIFSE